MEDEFKEIEKMNRPRWPIAILVVLLVGAAAAAYFWFGKPTGSSPLATTAQIQGVPIDITEPRNGSQHGSAPADFAWESIAGRHDYLFTLKREGAPAPLVERGSKTPTLQLTEDEWKLLGSGDYVWTVKARAKDGTVLGTGHGRFRVR